MGDERKKKAIESTIPLIFDAIDLNADGGIEVGASCWER